MPYICATNRLLIYICAFPLPLPHPPPIITVDLRKEEGGTKLKSNYLASSSKFFIYIYILHFFIYMKKKLIFYFIFLH